MTFSPLSFHQVARNLSYSNQLIVFSITELTVAFQNLNNMAKVQIKSEKLTPIGGFFRFANKIPLSLIGCEFEDEIDL